MKHAFVSITFVAVLTIVSGYQLRAQDAGRQSRSFTVGIAAGATIPNGPAMDLPADMGVHAQVSTTWNRSARLSFRGDLRAQVLSHAVAVADCIPNVPCGGIAAFHPEQVYSVAVSTEFRPFSAVRRLSGLVGVGAYYGRGPQSTDFGTTAGVLGGVGLDLGKAGGSGLLLEVQYHYLPNAFEDLRGMLTPSIGYRF